MVNIRFKHFPAILAGILLLLGMLACRSAFFSSSPTPTGEPVAGVNELHFQDPETGRRFRALDRCIADFTDETWHTTGYHLLGNFYTSSSCRGAGSRVDCTISRGIADDRDQQIVELYTLFYPQDILDVFGLGLSALWVPPSAGWGASFNFAENGGGVVGGGWGVNFREYTTATGEPTATVDLGWYYSYAVFETTLENSLSATLREDLASYLASPEAMRDRGLTQLDALAMKVEAAIQAHQIIACDRGTYQGNGIQPECTPRPLTKDEEAAELARAEAYFTRQQELLNEHYLDMYAAWMQAFPLDRCWP